MNNQKRKLGEIWKDGNKWYVQFPRGRMAFKTKKVAINWSNFILKNISE